jgi:hypothetical protein
MLKLTKQLKNHIDKEVSKKIDLLEKKTKKKQEKAAYAIKKKEREIEAEEKTIEFRKTFNTTVIGAFTFVAGLLWRDVADSIISLFMPHLEGIIGNTITASFVTIIIVILAVNITTKVKKQEEALQRKKEKLDKEKLEI